MPLNWTEIKALVRGSYRLEIKRSNKTEAESFGDMTGTF